MTLRTFSYGGGVQSTAALVLAARGEIDFPVFLFANVGDDSENPATLAYVRDVALPYAEARGLTLHELGHRRRDGTDGTLWRKLMNPESRSTGIPGYLGGSGAPGRRSCTAEFKIRRIAIWQRRHGATRDNPAVLGLGISIDEYQRMRTESGIPTQVLEYPLIDLRISRTDCRRIIEDAGLPVPPKSSCFFCPYHRMSEWRRLQREQPDLFERACVLDDTLNARSERLGRGGFFLSNRLIPLRQLLSAEQMTMDLDDEEDACESGFCMV